MLSKAFIFDSNPSLLRAAHSNRCTRLTQNTPSLLLSCQFWSSAARNPKISRNSCFNPTLEENVYTWSIDMNSGSFCISRLISSIREDEKRGHDTAADPNFITTALLLSANIRRAMSLALLGPTPAPSQPLNTGKKMAQGKRLEQWCQAGKTAFPMSSRLKLSKSYYQNCTPIPMDGRFSANQFPVFLTT